MVLFLVKSIFKKDKYRTVQPKSFIALICSIIIGKKDVVNKKAGKIADLSTFAPPAGLEPATL
jgi:hypothetical protein